MDADEVCLPEQVLLADVVDARLLALLGREVLAPGDRLHAERLADHGRAGAKFAEAEHAERGALELRPDSALPGLAGLKAGILVADMAGEFEHQADGDGGRRAARRAGAAGGGHAPGPPPP